jgi:uncharacterized protein YjcR
MAMDINQVRNDATLVIADALSKLYESADKDAMTDFAKVIAEAAVVAVQHVMDRAETEGSHESIR